MLRISIIFSIAQVFLKTIHIQLNKLSLSGKTDYRCEVIQRGKSGQHKQHTS